MAALDTMSTATSKSDVFIKSIKETQLIALAKELSFFTKQTCVHLEINLVMYDNWISFGRPKGAYIRDNSIQLMESIRCIITIDPQIFWMLSYQAKTVAIDVLYL